MPSPGNSGQCFHLSRVRTERLMHVPWKITRKRCKQKHLITHRVHDAVWKAWCARVDGDGAGCDTGFDLGRLLEKILHNRRKYSIHGSYANIRKCRSRTIANHERKSLGIRLQFDQLEPKVMASLHAGVFRQKDAKLRLTLLGLVHCTNVSRPTLIPYPTRHVHYDYR